MNRIFIIVSDNEFGRRVFGNLFFDTFEAAEEYIEKNLDSFMYYPAEMHKFC